MQPHAPELEEAVIGACLIEQEALPLIADKLRPEMFYDDHHQLQKQQHSYYAGSSPPSWRCIMPARRSTY